MNITELKNNMKNFTEALNMMDNVQDKQDVNFIGLNFNDSYRQTEISCHVYENLDKIAKDLGIEGKVIDRGSDSAFPYELNVIINGINFFMLMETPEAKYDETTV